MQSHETLKQAVGDAHKALAEESYQRAHSLAMSVLQKDPTVAEAYFIMALISYRHQNIAKAGDIILRALQFDAANPDYLLFQAQCLLEQNRHGRAKAVIAELDDQRLDSAHQNDTLGVLYSRLGLHKKALPRFNRACELEENSANYRYNLASCLQFSGSFELAELEYERVLTHEPSHYRTHSSLSQLRRVSAENNHIERLCALWSTLGSDASARLHIGHALAKEYEDLGQYQRSFKYLRYAKRKKLSQIEDHGDSNTKLFVKLQDLPEKLQSASISDCDSREPIFIVGMPRTGTTLVERILSNHSRVESAGELANFSLLVKTQLQTSSNWVLDAETVDAAHRLDFGKLGRDYIESTRHLTGGSAHFVDKMPLNFMYVLMIAHALPNAKIICLRRNPMDTCLSNYRQLFSSRFSYYNYAYCLQSTAQFYVHFHRLMDRYADHLGSRFYQIHYESLVENVEFEVLRLLEYCGLEWQRPCIEFQSNDTPVATASSVQVREKMYTRAVNRWVHYEPWLGEIRAVFEEKEIPCA